MLHMLHGLTRATLNNHLILESNIVVKFGSVININENPILDSESITYDPKG